MKYFNLATATELHNIMIAKIGGSSGHNDTQIGYLDSALQNIQDDMYYPKIEDKVSHLMFSCVKFHPFSDGNKRTSILLASAFLAKNDIKIDEKFFITMEDVVVKIATNEISKENLKDIFKAFIYDSKFQSG
ncbi:MAG: Fic family protein [Campylobacter sp.]|nr:Fic family protein [Campylobacter sp.]